MIRQLVQLWVGAAVLWLILAAPAWLLAGERGLADTALACGLCLAPMTATMLWCHWALHGAAESQLLAVLGGTAVRLVVVLAGGIGLFHAVEGLHRPAFLIWVIVFYLTTLTLEIVLVVRRQEGLANEAMAGRPQPPQP